MSGTSTSVTAQHALKPVTSKTPDSSFVRAKPTPVPRTSYPSFTPEMVQERIDTFLLSVRRFDELFFLPEPLPFSDRQKRVVDTCRTEVSRLAQEYSGLLPQLSRAPFAKTERDALDARWHSLYQADTAFSQGKCLGILFLASKQNAPWIQVFTDKKTEKTRPTPVAEQNSFARLRLFHEQKRYQEMVVLFDTLSNMEIATLSRDSLILIGNAMVKIGRTKDAASLFQIIANESSSPMDALRPLLKAADLFLATDDTDRARLLYTTAAKRYHSLSVVSFWPEIQLDLLRAEERDTPDFTLYRQLLADFQANDPIFARTRLMAQADALIRQYPDSLGAQGARALNEMITAIIQSWFDDKVDQIIYHVSQGDFVRVKALFAAMGQADLPGELRLLLSAKKTEVSLLEEGHDMAMLQKKQETLEEKWREAMSMYDANKFDEAIGSFATLLNTAFDARAREQIKVAARKAAEEKRKKAATLYVKARRTGEPERKADLCRESKALLLEILARYPETKISQKVKSNLAVVEECIHVNAPVISSAPGL